MVIIIPGPRAVAAAGLALRHRKRTAPMNNPSNSELKRHEYLHSFPSHSLILILELLATDEFL